MGVGWQATGCGRAPTEASWCPSDFLSLSLPPEPEDDRTEPNELGIKVGMEGLDRAALPTVEGVRDWEGILEKGIFKLSGKMTKHKNVDLANEIDCSVFTHMSIIKFHVKTFCYKIYNDPTFMACLCLQKRGSL